MLNFINKLPYKYFDIKTKIEYIERRIIIYSIQYYELDESVISDKDYDKLSKYLCKLINQNSDVFKSTEYYYCLYDFEPSTGFYIYDRLNEQDKIKLKHIAEYILMLYNTKRSK